MTNKARFLFAAAAVWLGLAMACSSPAGGGSPPTESPPDSWKATMKRIDDDVGHIRAQFQGPVEAADLQSVAGWARQAATLMASGYGVFEMRSVDGFADYARKAEAWLLDIALEAEAGKALLVRDLVDQADSVHCADCHHAADV